MQISFYKYQGTGNDFIMLDARSVHYELSQTQIAFLCDRRFGIGADGLIILQLTESGLAHMVYYNSDGNQSSMCGNGGRCFARFASDLGLAQNEFTFRAVDGMHLAHISDAEIALGMNDVHQIEVNAQGDYILNTGSPHYVCFVDQHSEDVDLISLAHSIRYNEVYRQQGINVNIVNVLSENEIRMRTYERGVEDETYSCGTGTVAASICFSAGKHKSNLPQQVSVQTKGGNLRVRFNVEDSRYTDVFLIGPAQFVFRGVIHM